MIATLWEHADTQKRNTGEWNRGARVKRYKRKPEMHCVLLREHQRTRQLAWARQQKQCTEISSYTWWHHRDQCTHRDRHKKILQGLLAVTRIKLITEYRCIWCRWIWYSHEVFIIQKTARIQIKKKHREGVLASSSNRSFRDCLQSGHDVCNCRENCKCHLVEDCFASICRSHP